MNEYLVEDEYSFYEIDPECTIGSRDECRKECSFISEKNNLPKRTSLHDLPRRTSVYDLGNEENRTSAYEAETGKILTADGCETMDLLMSKRTGNNRCACSGGSLLLLYLLFACSKSKT